jgi:RNA polymerase sigma-70 factor (ECF subfamily)
MDADEFITAFDNYHESIYRFVYYRLNQNKQIAEDLTSDIFLKAWEKRKKFNPAKSSLKTWLYTIARNSVIDIYRKKKKEINIEDINSDLIFSEEVNENNNLMNFLKAKLKLLNESEQELIILHYIEELEIKEVAVIIGKNYSATKVAINRALNKLKILVNK